MNESNMPGFEERSDTNLKTVIDGMLTHCLWAILLNSSVTESPFAQLLRPLNLKMHAFL